jgi:serine/threonine-protein kinase RsbW
MEKKIKKDLSSLNDMFDFIEQYADKNQLNPDIRFALNLAAEEIFTNLVKYNTQSRNDIRITLQKKSDRVILALTDFNVEKFDINQIKQYNIHQPLPERPVGKLGIPIVKKLMDKVEYEYKNRNSTITLVKYVRNGYV